MNAETFLEQFETFAEAPSGVEQLRAMILQLAVQGKLVPQDPKDEPASRLLEVIRRSRRLYWEQIESEKMKVKGIEPENDDWKLKHQEIEPLAAERFPNSQANWEWVRVKVIGEVQLGRQRAPKFQNGPNIRPYLRVQNVYEDRIDATDLNYMNFSPLEFVTFHLRDGDILLNEGQSFKLVGRPAIYRNEVPGACFQNTLIRLRLYSPIEPEFVLLVFRGYMRTGKFQSVAQQTTNIAHLSAGRFAELEFPLPPLAEQKRIVAKVDQLLALCDELAARQEARRVARAQLVGATLDRLVSTRSAADLPPHVNRLRTHFDHLFDTPTTIQKLRQTILQLAVQGQLVPQDPNDEPAKISVSRAEKERQRLISNGELREDKTLVSPPIDIGDGIPTGWCNVRIGHITNCLDHIRKPVSKAERELRAGDASIPYYGANGQVGWIDQHIFDEDLVLVVEDESFIGRVKPFSYRVTGKCWVNNHAHVLQPMSAIDPDYLNTALSYYPFTPLTSGTTNRKKLTKVGLLNAPLCIPPLAEQKRIVAKVTELLSLCDTLEAQLQTAESASSQLLSAAVHHLLST